MRFRFTPAVMGHALTHRVSEGGFDPELIKAWDYDGWQYAVMSSLAVSGSVMPTILPYEADLVPGYAGFYQKWKQWAKDTFEYVNHTEPFGEQVQPGAVDGYARIKGDHGFLFLFNGNPRPALITFEVGDEINLQADGDYQFAELYPSERSKLVLDANGKSVFARGEMAGITVPANGCYLLELRKVTGQSAPLLVGAAGEVALADGQMAITGVEGKPGQQVGIRVRIADPDAVQGVTVNGIAQNFTRTTGEIDVELQFAGDKYVRELDAWTQTDGERFDFPVHPAGSGLQLTTSFRLNGDVPQLLEGAKPKNFAEMDGKIAAWQATRGGGGYHNFICERPSRLWLIVPVRTPARVEVTLNGAKVDPLRWDAPSSSAFADLTDLVNYGGENRITLSINGLPADGFMGPFLLYPAEAGTDRVLPKPADADQPVVYKQSLAPALPTRYRENAGPKVIEAKMMENVTLREAAELRVTLDLPPDQIKRVMFFESGFGWMGQHGLGYNNEAQCWTALVAPGNRAAIQENACIYVWAEGKDGLRSDYHPVKVGWDFTATARKAKVVAGAIEAEFLKVQSKSRSKVEPQDMAPYGNHWSGGNQMVWWGGLEHGDSMALEVPLEKAGVYALALHLSKAEDYGIFSVRLDDGPETEAVDFFHSKLQPPTIITLKPMTLAKGKHSLRITCHGKNPKSTNSLIGMDCLEFKEATR
jgi:hypothetical protein